MSHAKVACEHSLVFLSRARSVVCLRAQPLIRHFERNPEQTATGLRNVKPALSCPHAESSEKGGWPGGLLTSHKRNYPL